MNTPDHAPRDFRLFLQQELARRCKKNPHFSLRAFAKSLDIEVSSLSKILNGKRSLTRKMLHRISSQLGLGPDRISHFEQGLSLPRRRAASVEAFTQLNLDTYTVISDWYHYAILELVRLKNFQPNPAWIAKTLSITVSEVNFAIERLQRLGMLEISKHGWQQKAGQLTTIGSKLTATALRKLQQQILAQATDALNSVPMQQRDQSAMTMSIDSSKIAEAKLRIQKFRRELCEFLEAGDNCDEVYQLSISLFPISNTGTRK